MRYPFLVDGIDGQTFAVEVPLWFGAPTLLVNGQPAPPGKGPREFLIAHPQGGTVPVRIELTQWGTVLAVTIEDETISLTKPLAWYEWVWNGLPFLLVVAGGFAGALLGGLAAGLNLKFFRSVSNLAARYALTAAISLAALLAYLAVVAGINRASGRGAAVGAADQPSVAARPVAARVRALVLPQDWKTLREVCQAEIKGGGFT